jgi:hypothetical protein
MQIANFLLYLDVIQRALKLDMVLADDCNSFKGCCKFFGVRKPEADIKDGKLFDEDIVAFMSHQSTALEFLHFIRIVRIVI